MSAQARPGCRHRFCIFGTDAPPSAWDSKNHLMLRRILLVAVAAAASATAAAGPESDGLVGTWLTDGGDSRIRIAPCGNAFCGTVVWAKTNGLDTQNPDPALRKRTIVGMPLTRDMKPDGKGRWAGSIYNPENGKTYEITMQVKGTDTLEVEGCVLSVLCGSERWTRTNQETASATYRLRGTQ